MKTYSGPSTAACSAVSRIRSHLLLCIYSPRWVGGWCPLISLTGQDLTLVYHMDDIIMASDFMGLCH